jgi:hypothetical protein
MKKMLAFNPYLPCYEYIPDGEPYVFENRVYIFGSHDKFDGEDFCLNDYVSWSAPVDNLGDWRYEGVIYKRTQDPGNADKRQFLYAPDLQRGVDGRYYLYYAMKGAISVAVCDTPAGQYQFYGNVKTQGGAVAGGKPGELFQFDPGVLVDDDGRVYLYSGFAPKPDKDSIFDKYNLITDGGYFMELKEDMLTLKRGPELLFPGVKLSGGTSYEGHEFFEASSMRKINGKYYFIYSSINSHELCYAVSDRPDGGFIYKGTIVSNGDVGLKNPGGRKMINYTGNTHGSIVEINREWYVFYHRQTNFHHYSRQACAEPVTIKADGSIPQVEITSCGLNRSPLPGKGVYEARIACNLLSKEGAVFYPIKKENASIHPYFTQDKPDSEECSQYIANIQDGAIAGYKYFNFIDAKSISIKIRGNAKGVVLVSTAMDGNGCARIHIDARKEWSEFSAPFVIANGKQALYFTFNGEGVFDFLSFEIG